MAGRSSGSCATESRLLYRSNSVSTTAPIRKLLKARYGPTMSLSLTKAAVLWRSRRRSDLKTDFRRGSRIIEQSLIWRCRLMVALVDLRAVTLLFSKFEGRLEVVHEEPRRIVETAQFGGGLQAFEPPIADDAPGDGAVLLFDPSLIVLTVGPRTRELDPVRYAIVLDRRVHENAIVVRI